MSTRAMARMYSGQGGGAGMAGFGQLLASLTGQGSVEGGGVTTTPDGTQFTPFTGKGSEGKSKAAELNTQIYLQQLQQAAELARQREQLKAQLMAQDAASFDAANAAKAKAELDKDKSLHDAIMATAKEFGIPPDQYEAFKNRIGGIAGQRMSLMENSLNPKINPSIENLSNLGMGARVGGFKADNYFSTTPKGGATLGINPKTGEQQLLQGQIDSITETPFAKKQMLDSKTGKMIPIEQELKRDFTTIPARLNVDPAIKAAELAKAKRLSGEADLSTVPQAFSPENYFIAPTPANEQVDYMSVDSPPAGITTTPQNNKPMKDWTDTLNWPGNIWNLLKLLPQSTGQGFKYGM